MLDDKCMRKTYTYTIELEPVEEGGFVVTVPALPGCFTQGETFDEAIAMAHEAIEGFLEALAKAGEPIPLEEHGEPLKTTIRVKPPAAA